MRTPPGPPVGIKTDDLANIIKQSVAAAVAEVTKSHAKTQAAVAADQTRRDFIDQQMKGIPDAYLKQLPATTDTKALADAAKQIRTQFQADFQRMGVCAPAIGSDVPAAGTVFPSAHRDDGADTAGDGEVEGSQPQRLASG